MIQSTRTTVLNVGKVTLPKEEYKRFEKEYLTVEKYIRGLNVDTQVNLVKEFINEN